jgi:HEAT repeat protein
MDLPEADLAALAPDQPEAALAAVLTAIEEGARRAPAGSGDLLGALLSHPSRTVKRRAAGALASSLDREVVDVAFVESLLDAGEAATRWGAAFALHRAGRPTARMVDVALETFGQESGDLRWAASTVIANAAHLVPDLAGRLRALATGGSATTRKMAILCLADAGDRDAAFACGALRDENLYVRLAAVTVLGRLGDASPAVREALAAAAASDAEATVRRAAGAVLDRLERARKKEQA